MRKKSKYILGLIAGLFILSVQPARAADAPAPSLFSNPMAITMLVLMVLLLVVIGILANILIGTADFKLKKKTKGSGAVLSTIFLLGFMLAAPALFAQGTPEAATTTSTAAKTIGGMEPSTFYILATVLFLELFIIIALLINIKFLLKAEKDKLLTAEEMEEVKKTRLSWWDSFNKLKPVSQEAELDLGHEYDGIRELNNRLPPWWLYGFYLTIVFAAIYLWRFHISHTGPSSKEEYDRSVASAQVRIDEYLKKKGESVDENNVTLLTSADDIKAGKAIFTDPAKCPACHAADGGGNTVGPNLADNFWLYGGGIKDIFKTIKYGTNKGMRSWKDDLSPKQIAQVASYVKSLKGTKPAAPKEPQGLLYEETAATDTVKKAAADTAGTLKK
jgi:cytochrome c oxidase cbb3-type subunit 3